MQTLKGGKSAVGHGNKLRPIFFNETLRTNQTQFRVEGVLRPGTRYGIVTDSIGTSFLTRDRREAERDSVLYQKTGFFKITKIVEIKNNR